MLDGKVFPVVAKTKDEVSDALARDWLRLAPIGLRCQFAAQIGARDAKTVSKAISGEHLPEAHTIFNSLLVDPSALFNTFRMFGGVFVPSKTGVADDNEIIAQLLHAASEYYDRMRDKRRCHQDTLALAAIFIPLIPAMLAICEEADRHRSAA